MTDSLRFVETHIRKYQKLPALGIITYADQVAQSMLYTEPF